MLNEVPPEVVHRDIAIYFPEKLKDIPRHLDRHIISRLVDKAGAASVRQQQLVD